MGDNIYLGDRNGVRTPMQWSGDRNGGFSRADPARLYAPPIMDPVYGYQAINVEAQERYPVLAAQLDEAADRDAQAAPRLRPRLARVRRLRQPQGARLPAPRRAAKRSSSSPTCRAACSRVELDLSAFAGLIPVEMTGAHRVPADHRAARTSSRSDPYASYWFTLQHDADAGDAKATTRRRIANAAIARGAARAARRRRLGGRARAPAHALMLERQALVPFLKRQRWFASKSREIRQARFTDWATIRTGSTPAFIALVVGELHRGLDGDLPAAAGRRVGRGGGPRDQGAPGQRAGPDDRRAQGRDRRRRLRRGHVQPAAGPGRARARIADRHRQPAWRAHDEPSSISRPNAAGCAAPPIRATASLFVNERYVLKLFRRVEPGIESRVRDAGPPHQARLREDPAADGRALPSPRRSSSRARSPSSRASSAIRDPAGTSRSTTCAATTRRSRRARRSAEAPLEAPRARHALPPFLAAIERWYLASARAARPADRGDASGARGPGRSRASRPSRSAPRRARRRIAR